MKIRILKTARQDMDDIYDYWVQRAGPETTRSLIYSITDLFLLIAEFPLVGRACDEIAAGVRVFPSGNYLIYYSKKRGTIQILHVFHAAREQGRAFKND